MWGTGINQLLGSFPREAKVFAVRGPMTRDNLIELGIECPPIYGDPGLLMPYLCPVSRTDEHKWGVIPNYVDIPLARQVLSTRDTRLIDVRSGIEDVMRETARCAYIASSSLHGIVLAESLGIPAVFVQFGDNVIGGTLKYDDYYLSTNRAPVVPLDWRHTVSLSEGLDIASRIPAPIIDLDRLVQACPFNFLGIGGVKEIVPIRTVLLPAHQLHRQKYPPK